MARKPPKGKSLAEKNPELAQQWHTSKNGYLTPFDVSYGTAKKVWWQCEKSNDHEWEARVDNRNHGRKCPFCSGQKVVKSNCLSQLRPELAKEWHLTKNGNLTPYDVTENSGKKVWWKCDKGDDHEWISSIDNRSKGRDCPVCTGKKIVISNSLATLHPKLSKQWHPTKNGGLTPSDFGVGSNKKIWWKCDKGDDHEWIAKIYHRTSGIGCSVCSGMTVVKSNCLYTTHPELAKEWHPTKNGDLRPLNVISGSQKKVWWKCEKGDDHEWCASINSRASGNCCSVCAGQKIVLSNCLTTLNPDLAKEWHPTKNGNLTPSNFGVGSGKKVWWKCDKGDDHEWMTTIASRSSGIGCSICAGQKIVLSNCLTTLNPDLAKEWHPTKNGNLTPYDVTENSGKKVWWKCDKGDDHEWMTTIASRSSGTDCSVCSGMKVVKSNCLSTKNPELAKQWHPTKNGSLTPLKVIEGSHKKVWWKCNKGADHEWIATVGDRSQGNNCPFCTLTPQSKQELTITFELIQFFKDINPRGFKTRVNGKVRSVDIYIPRFQLAIEFDGSYWHKGKREFDKLKTIQLKEEGLDVIRIREQSKAATLKKITKNDVISNMPFNGKEVVNNVLKQIMKMYELDTKKIAKIESYIAKKELQNEKGLDKYIEMILTEKAEKK